MEGISLASDSGIVVDFLPVDEADCARYIVAGKFGMLRKVLKGSET